MEEQSNERVTQRGETSTKSHWVNVKAIIEQRKQTIIEPDICMAKFRFRENMGCTDTLLTLQIIEKNKKYSTLPSKIKRRPFTELT